MCLSIGETILASITEIETVLSSQSTVGAPVWNAKASMYLHTALVFLTDFYMHLISPPVELDITSV